MQLSGSEKQIKCYRPQNRDELAMYCDLFCGVRVPGKKICDCHDSPLDYLSYVFLEGDAQRGDVLVWANRGGGKTKLGAIASLLDCVFNPNCDIRILGGSMQQSQQMYSYFREMLDMNYTEFLKDKLTMNGCKFSNQSTVQVLTQSQSSVRGQHVQRLRCDEVELFDRSVWQAAQYVTQSKGSLAGRLEAMSTMHMPYGLMSELVEGAGEGGYKLFRWCLMEILEKCVDRECSQCYLSEDCRGRAKDCEGYFGIDDAISQKRRGSSRGWQSEMMCLRPGASDQVFDDFDINRHVYRMSYDAGAELYRSFDFGYSNPLVCLLIQVKGGLVQVLDEHVMVRKTIAEHAQMIKRKWRWPVTGNYCDPAGRQRNDVTGSSVVDELVSFGICCESRSSRVLEGIELIRSYILSGDGIVRLLIDPKCKRLIKALQMLRYKKVDGGLSEMPEKDGEHDHLIDALRYFFVNRFGNSYEALGRKY